MLRSQVKSRQAVAVAMTLGLVSLTAVSSADTLVMRDGRRLEGTVVSLSDGTITFRQPRGTVRSFRVGQVDVLEFVPVERGGPRGTSGRGDDPDSRGGRPPGRGAEVGDRGLELTAGTEIMVRTGEEIDSRTAGPDQTFLGVIEEDIMTTAGRVIVPDGSSARLVIRRLESGGRTGSPEMVLDLASITVDGRRYRVSTADLSLDSDTGLGANRRTATVVGGGAALGTIIGAIAGGGKGAAIGALLGAGGGAGVQVLTKGRDVRVPTETVLRFRLDRAVTLQPER